MAKKTKKVVKAQLYPVVIVKSSHTTESQSSNSSEFCDMHFLTDIKGVYQGIPDKDYSEIVVPFEVEVNKEYFLVYVEYNSGDSFHHETGRISYVDLFKTKEKAEACAKAIEDHYKQTPDGLPYHERRTYKPPKGFKGYSVDYINEAGEAMTVSASWTGYFERLTSVVVKKVWGMPPHEQKEGLIRYEY